MDCGRLKTCIRLQLDAATPPPVRVAGAAFKAPKDGLKGAETLLHRRDLVRCENSADVGFPEHWRLDVVEGRRVAQENSVHSTRCRTLESVQPLGQACSMD